MAFIRLLLVDDDEVTLLILSALLQEQGFEVTTASTVSEVDKFERLRRALERPAYAGCGRWTHGSECHASRQS
jgi:CheY-like chemotaxis protein